MSLLCSSGSAIPSWMFRALCVPSCHVVQRRVRIISPLCPLPYTNPISKNKQTKQTPSLLQNEVLLAIRYHIPAPDELDNTVRILLQLSTYHIEVLPLSSGKSGAVSGEVRIGPLVACSASFLRALL
jgi:hypothetical protein